MPANEDKMRARVSDFPLGSRVEHLADGWRGSVWSLGPADEPSTLWIVTDDSQTRLVHVRDLRRAK
jgi:hypothetical protein